MTPAARVQAAIELLDAIIAAAQAGGAAADSIISRYFAERRYAGSKDRRAVRELVYAAIRLAGEAPESGRAAMLGLAAADPGLRLLFDGSPRAPARVMPGEPVAPPGVAPDWLVAKLAESGIGERELPALVARAPLDLRVNRLHADPAAIAAELADLGAAPVAGVPDALRLPTGSQIEHLDLYRDGVIEVQDAGSQMAALAVQAAPDMTVIDLCAGAGGKALALAAAMRNRGRLIATDTDRARLLRLPPRAVRAGATIVTTRLLDAGREAEALADLVGQADAVLVDAPCSGSGTWRRNPETRWRLTPARLDRLIETQRRLLALAATLVRPGGALIHVVCSLIDGEGRDQAAAFLAANPGWRAVDPGLAAGRRHGAGVRLTPAYDGTDGFFIARIERPC